MPHFNLQCFPLLLRRVPESLNCDIQHLLPQSLASKLCGLQFLSGWVCVQARARSTGVPSVIEAGLETIEFLPPPGLRGSRRPSQRKFSIQSDPNPDTDDMLP